MSKSGTVQKAIQVYFDMFRIVLKVGKSVPILCYNNFTTFYDS